MKKIFLALALLICFAAPAAAADLNAVSGTYLLQSDKKEFLKLRPDATFVLRQRKKPADSRKPFTEFSGKYELNGKTIKLILSDGGTAEGRLIGKVFTDGQGDRWVKEGTPKHKSWWRRF